MYELVKQCVKNVKNELNQLPHNADALNSEENYMIAK